MILYAMSNGALNRRTERLLKWLWMISITLAFLSFGSHASDQNASSRVEQDGEISQINWKIFQHHFSSKADVAQMEALRELYFKPGNPFEGKYNHPKAFATGSFGKIFRCKSNDNEYAIKRVRKPRKGKLAKYFNAKKMDWENCVFLGEKDKLHYTIRKPGEEEFDCLKTQIVFTMGQNAKFAVPTFHSVLLETLIQQKSTGIQSEYVMEIIETYETDTHYYMVMDYIKGARDLFDYVNKRDEEGNVKLLRQGTAARIFNKIVHGLKAIHDAGFGHYDLKLENILVYFDSEKNLKIKIIDFGLALHNDCYHPNGGTAVCCSPEQRGEGRLTKPQNKRIQLYTQRADFWSLGVILYTMLHGYAPFADGKQAQTKRFKKHVYDKKVQLGFTKLIKVKLSCMTLITRCLRIDPTKRPTFNEGDHRYIFIGLQNWAESLGIKLPVPVTKRELKPKVLTQDSTAPTDIDDNPITQKPKTLERAAPTRVAPIPAMIKLLEQCHELPDLPESSEPSKAEHLESVEKHFSSDNTDELMALYDDRLTKINE